jgi:DNA polymerase III subunit delta
MAIYLLHGDEKSTDAFLIRARLSELLKGIPRDGNINFASFDLASSGTTFHDVVASALTIPFLGGGRTVVAVNAKAIDKSFAKKAGKDSVDDESDEPDEEKSSGSGDDLVRSAEQLSHLPKEALLVLVEENGRLDGRSRFYKALTKAGCKVESFKGMWFDPASGDTDKVVEFIKQQAAKLNLRLPDSHARKFAELVGSDSGAIIKELEKLQMYAGPGSRLSETDIEAVVTPSYESGIFQLCDLVGYGKTGAAIDSLKDLLDHGAAAPYILAMIARQIRLITRVREAQARGVKNNELAKELGESPFVIRKVQTQVRTFPRFEYPVFLELLMDTDIHLKRGTMPPKLALEELITKIAVGRR